MAICGESLVRKGSALRLSPRDEEWAKSKNAVKNKTRRMIRIGGGTGGTGSGLEWKSPSLIAVACCSLVVSLFLLQSAPQASAAPMVELASSNSAGQARGGASDGDGSPSGAAATAARNDQQETNRAALEAELNSIMQQHEGSLDAGRSKQLSEAIITRLMLDNLTGPGFSSIELGPSAADVDGLDMGALSEMEAAAALTSAQPEEPVVGAVVVGPQPLAAYSVPERLRMKKLLSMVQNYDLPLDDRLGQFPILPAGQAATMKRATSKMSNYLKHQQQLQQQQQRQLVNNYGRNTFDFGLGKRPDAAVSSNILRFGDTSLMGSGGAPGSHVQAVSGSQFGKRPSAHRFDFGLGKRVASPAYPRYDFGLGKRAPSRVRYDFGLGK